MSQSSLLFLHALSPVHCGTGQSIGAVDLPIAREASTKLPLIPGSSLKGSLRSEARAQLTAREVTELFGPETADASDHSGALSFGDARLLCLPVRALRGTFAWVTSPLLLTRLLQDVEVVTDQDTKIPLLADHFRTLSQKIDRAYVCPDSQLRAHSSQPQENNIYFEDLDLRAQPSSDLQLFARWLGACLFPGEGKSAALWREMLRERLCLVSDDVLMFFAKNALEFTTRIALNPDTKTVKDSALWTEEALPTESILVSLCTPTAGRRAGLSLAELTSAMRKITAAPLQVGGNATVGQGRCMPSWFEGA